MTEDKQVVLEMVALEDDDLALILGGHRAG